MWSKNKTWDVLFLAILAGICLMAARCCYNKAYNNGWNNAYNNGWADGRDFAQSTTHWQVIYAIEKISKDPSRNYRLSLEGNSLGGSCEEKEKFGSPTNPFHGFPDLGCARRQTEEPLHTIYTF